MKKNGSRAPCAHFLMEDRIPMPPLGAEERWFYPIYAGPLAFEEPRSWRTFASACLIEFLVETNDLIPTTWCIGDTEVLGVDANARGYAMLYQSEMLRCAVSADSRVVINIVDLTVSWSFLV